MTFPVIYNLAGHEIHAHAVFETLGYSAGSLLYRFTRRASPLQKQPVETTLWILSAAIFGAWAGSKILAILELWPHYKPLLLEANPNLLFQGKTIVGGLLGAWLGVELAKLILGVKARTGDAFVLPLTAGIAIGRLGCFLEGLPDHTYGLPSSLPWAVDFGDGIPRHPTQLYESLTVLLLGLAILTLTPRRPVGHRFRLFFLGYLSFRLLVEFLKPREVILLALSPIQWAAFAGLLATAWQLKPGSECKKTPSTTPHPTLTNGGTASPSSSSSPASSSSPPPAPSVSTN